MAGAVQRGPDELGHPGIDDDLAPAALADVQDAGDEPAGPGDERAAGLDGEARRPAVVRDAARSARELAGEAFGPGVGSAGGKTGKPPPTSSVSKSSGSPRRRATTARPRRTASRHASTARSCEPTWRWTPRGRIAPPALAERADDAGRLRLGHAELGRPGPDGEAGDRLGRHVRVEPDEDVERRPAAVPETGARGPWRRTSASSADSSATHASGVPRCGRAHGAPQVGVGLADALERDPVVGDARRRATAHSPRDTTLAPKPRAATSATIAGTSLALTEYWRIHGSGKATASGRGGRVSAARSVT